MEKIKILELFSGYGSQKLALDYLGIPCESTQCEIDKYAVDAYNQIHGETENLGDICKVDETKLPYYDLITYSSPCQDFSVAGLQKGGDKDSGTRSSLLWECERIIKAVKPKYLLMENVKNLVGKQHKHNFIAWLDTLDALGYNNYWQVLNAKDYGVPQNRERVFVVSIRKDIQQGYTFPEKIPLEKRLKDILEDSVEEKYYLSEKLIKGFITKQERGSGFAARGINIREKDGYASTLTARMWKMGITDNYLIEPLACAGRGRNPENPSDRTVGAPTEQRLEINESGCSNTLTSVQKDNWVIEPLVYDEQNGYIRQDGCIGTLTTDGSSPKHNNRVIEPNVIQLGNIVETGNWDNPQRGRIYSAEGCSPALNTMQGGGLEPKILESYVEKQYNKFIDENGGIYEYTYKRIHTLLRVLWREIRTKEIWKEVGGFQCVQKEKILFSGMYEEGYAKDREIPTNIFNSTLYSKDNKSFIVEQNFLRDMWERIKTRRASQRWGLSKQQFREFACCMQKLSYQVTQAEEEMCYLWKTNESLRVLRQTLSEIQKIWKSFSNQQRTRTLGYRIRKLTPRECWRLQGVKDEDFNKLHGISNTQLYKMAGNSIVADVLVAIFRNLFINKTEYVKKGNLFNL